MQNSHDIIQILAWQKELDAIMMKDVPPIEGVGLAIGVELAESLYYYPIKWWKNDIVQTDEEYLIRFGMFLEEIIDAIHFAATYAYRKNIAPKLIPLPDVPLVYVQKGAYAHRFAIEARVGMLPHLQRVFWTEFPNLLTTIDLLFSYASHLAKIYYSYTGKPSNVSPLLLAYGRKATINVFRTKYPEALNSLKHVKLEKYIRPSVSIYEIAEEVYNAVQKGIIRV